MSSGDGGAVGLDEGTAATPTKCGRARHEKRFHGETMVRLQAEYQLAQTRLDGMYLDKLDGPITVAFFDRKATEWRRQQSAILSSIEEHQQANQTYLDDGVRILELAGRAHDLFLRLDPKEKRRLLSLLVANSTWQEGRLSVAFRAPFDIILGGALRAETSKRVVLASALRLRSSTRRESPRSNSLGDTDSNSKAAPKGLSRAETEIWLRRQDSNLRPCG